MSWHPGAVLAAIEAALRARGLTRLYSASCSRYAVLSVACGVTVWCDGRLLRWRHAGEPVTWPARDPDGAALRLATLVDAARDATRSEPL